MGYMTEKIALNALKARQLAKEVGLIPHHNSQWKWALRQLRQPNPEGVVGKKLMQEGRELAESKLRIGKLPNNKLQRLLSQERKFGGGNEALLLNNGDVIRGSQLGVQIPVGKADSVLAHTHPAGNKYLYGKTPPPDMIRLQDTALRASPSGLFGGLGEYKALRKMYNNNLAAEAELKGLTPGLYKTKVLTKLRNFKNKLKQLNSLQTDIKRKIPLINERRNALLNSAQGSSLMLDKLLQHDNSSLAELLQKAKALREGVPANWQNMKITESLPELDRMIDAYSQPNLLWGGDMNFLSRGALHNIITPEVIGVHKYRPKLDNFVRSVYFNR